MLSFKKVHNSVCHAGYLINLINQSTNLLQLAAYNTKNFGDIRQIQFNFETFRFFIEKGHHMIILSKRLRNSATL